MASRSSRGRRSDRIMRSLKRARCRSAARRSASFQVDPGRAVAIRFDPAALEVDAAGAVFGGNVAEGVAELGGGDLQALVGLVIRPVEGVSLSGSGRQNHFAALERYIPGAIVSHLDPAPWISEHLAAVLD